ncbi:beta-ketoacyl-ACP synthase II [Chloroflexota bacterium]
MDTSADVSQPVTAVSNGELDKVVADFLEHAEPRSKPTRRWAKRGERAKPRVVITGMGVVTPLGLTVDEYWGNLTRGKSGIGQITLCDASGLSSTIAGEVKDFDPRGFLEAKEVKHMARFSQFAVAAANMAIDNAKLELSAEAPDRMGVLIGNGIGGLPDTEEWCRVLFSKGGMRVTPHFMPIILPNMAAAQLSLRLGLKGFSSTVTTACAAATQAIGEALEVIRRGAADVMITGGSEAGITAIGLAGFCVMKALSTRNDEPARASRPFDAMRDGFVPAEGAGILVIESLEHAQRRGAPILAELAGIGVSSDAHHVVAPESNGDGAARAMRWALADAGLKPVEIDYINAHGTSTPLNDATETRAIKQVFADHAYKLSVSSTKSMIGHLLGASGAVEAVACIKAITDGLIHPTINYEHPDPDCDLDYVVDGARRCEVRAALSNSFGFGGQNACLVFKKYPQKG